MAVSYRVEFTRSAKKEFLALRENVQDQVIESIEVIRKNPSTTVVRIRKPTGVESVYRFRVGDSRVIHELRARQLVILVIKIGNRREVYRSF
jgi:mRNA interferase RelE/StbE